MSGVREQDIRYVVHRDLGVLGLVGGSSSRLQRGKLTFFPSPAIRSNLSHAIKNQPIGKPHSGPWWYCRQLASGTRPIKLTFQPFAMLLSELSFELS